MGKVLPIRPKGQRLASSHGRSVRPGAPNGTDAKPRTLRVNTGIKAAKDLLRIPWPEEALRLAKDHGVELPKPRRLLAFTTVEVKTISEANSRAHWSKKAARAAEQRKAVGDALRKMVEASGLEIPNRPLVVVLTRIAPGTLDDDNLGRALKACRDGVAEFLGIDDRERHRVAYECQQRKGGQRVYAVRVEIWEVGE